jgi:hypothetical protein
MGQNLRYLIQGLCYGLILALLFMNSTAFAQNVISGEISGVVTDTDEAVVPGATVTITNKDMGFNQTATTSGTGSYRFPLLQPGDYVAVTTAKGFATATQRATVLLGKVTTLPIQLKLSAVTQTVEVTSELPLLETENANLATTFTPKQIELLPNPGADLTNYALTAPGVALNTGGGYGNFTAYGLPATSNVFTINGMDMNDPFNNLNYTGPSNLMLGQNQVQEVAIVNNGYTGQYGRGAGSNMTFATKSGTNGFHGNAKWDWNGSALNANDWFNNNTDTPRPFANNNQWAGSFGGPIKKDKLFFFYDNEGARYVLPGGGPVYIPTPAFAQAVQANINATQPQESQLYQKMFNLYAGAPGARRAVPLSGDGGCGDLALDSNGNPTATPIGGQMFGYASAGGQPCTQSFRNTANALNTEMLQSLRIDLIASDKDRMHWRYWQDGGYQPSYTDPINAAFNIGSHQNQYAGQFAETHIFSPNVVNQFILSGMYYTFLFQPSNMAATTALFPFEIDQYDGNLSSMGGILGSVPSGRNLAQYQFVDDLSWTRRNHAYKFGVNFRRVNWSTYATSAGQTGSVSLFSMTDFANGTLGPASSYQQQFATAGHYPLSNYSLGLYVQDEWRASRRLRLTLALRVDRNSNITCNNNCFSVFNTDFETISHLATTPYNQSILTNQSQLFHSIEPVVWEPRIGAAYKLWENAVLRGGVGIFSDLYPGTVADKRLLNPPYSSLISVSGTPFVGTNGAQAQAAATYAALLNGFSSGMTGAGLQALGLSVPDFQSTTSNLVNPKYVEWNVQLQQALGDKNLLSLNYVGNHGYDLFLLNNGLNAYAPGGFGGLPTAVPDGNYGTVRELTNGGISNYNGLTVSLVRKFSHGFQGAINYTWSHSLDNVSNAGMYQYSLQSLIHFITPNKLNYGNSDYDFRHLLTMNYVWELPFRASNAIANQLVKGWSVAGVLITRSGQPYSVVNSTLAGALNNNFGGYVLADFLGGPVPSCSPTSQCLLPSQFATSQTDLGNVARNHFRGPGYFNTDLSVRKNFQLTEKMTFVVGANAYNVLNHPNFANPNNDVASGSAFGQIQNTVTPPTSPYGAFQGAAVSGRVIQLETQVKF